MTIYEFIERWSQGWLNERAHFQTFIGQLCRILGAPVPDEDRPGDPDYGFEKPVRLTTSRKASGVRPGSIDLYRRGCFVMEAKQSDRPRSRAANGRRGARGSVAATERLMRRAKLEAEDYANALAERPPFLIVTNVGRSLELWANFNTSGGAYTPFLVGGKQTIFLEDLIDPEVRAVLARVWTDPQSLNPERHLGRVTGEIVKTLSGLVRAMAAREPTGPKGRLDPVQENAAVNKACIFISQCMFAMFLDSAGLLKGGGFRRLMQDYRDQPRRFPLAAADVFEDLQRGGHCAAIRQDVPHFQRDILGERVVPIVTVEDLDILIEAAKWDWSRAGPDLFGLLLETVMDPARRASLGMHFTDKGLVERVVLATVMEPLRLDWSRAEAQALQAAEAGDQRRADQLIRSFHRKLCATKVLDPACGTGNFLYVCLGLMKSLETEVLSTLADLDQGRSPQPSRMVGPGQFVGLEKDGATGRIARLVMAIGQVQSQARSERGVGSAPSWDSVDIRIQDALLSHDVSADTPRLIQREVTARPWPEVDFIVGNPPFLGGSVQRRVLGAAYVNALNDVREGRFRSADLAACWWDRAARILARHGTRLRRFGFILPASIRQNTSGEVLAHHLNGDQPMRLAFAIPDHPWTSLLKGASVRVAITVVERGAPDGEGRLLTLEDDPDGERAGATVRSMHPAGPVLRERRGDIRPDLTLGFDVKRAAMLKANQGLAARGVQVNGAGFVVDAVTAARLFADSAAGRTSPARPYRNGRDLTGRPRKVQVIDFSDWEENEVRRLHPGFHQHLLVTVKPGRQTKARARYRRDWWLFGEPRIGLRNAMHGLARYIVTIEIGKHRWFRFLDAEIVPDNRLVCVASDDAFILGVLSSRVHSAWAAATGGFLEDRPTYPKLGCFDAFPFPQADTAQRVAITELAEALDSERAKLVDVGGGLTMTGLYNALQDLGGVAKFPWKLRGRVERISRLHEEIDARVTQAYGWPTDLPDEEMVTRLVSLNLDRQDEEGEGRVAWLRPEFQLGQAAKPIRRPRGRHNAVSVTPAGP